MSDQPAKYNQGRGAQINPANRFHEHDYGLEPLQPDARTQYIPVYPKTILNRVESPDIGMAWSMNPYQGCEHGCIYCYARNTHNYWGYSAGLDFEQKVLYKKDAPQLLEQQLKKKNWKPEPIMLAGNTDCYQPAEQTLGITREILKVLWKYRHPVGIITKNSMVLRDLDLLQPMAENRLLRVSISLTTLDEKLRRLLEPRTASVKARLKTIEVLAAKGIPVNVMMAPIIPGLNDHEILEVGQKVSSLGAVSMAYTMVRLNGDVAAIFEDWIRKTMPDRADRVLNRIRDVHGGELNDSRFGTRMRGEGQFAEVVKQQFQLARQRYFADKVKPDYNLDLFEQGRNPQMSLF
ncbi:PA0069 family radical SAM protein [Phaeodactylibacter xiamenensis]|uniref:PA0069 family radical SAM protein n=1 Tax=Phaeodactylibacter xiamenensis TaxID=1524460 RepID=UPI0024A84A0B|nr:PA0069 family radical SAM protein [Phaeodactylibacter xiamenensis]